MAPKWLLSCGVCAHADRLSDEAKNPRFYNDGLEIAVVGFGGDKPKAAADVVHSIFQNWIKCFGTEEEKVGNSQGPF